MKVIFIEESSMFSNEAVIPGNGVPMVAGHLFYAAYRGSFHGMFTGRPGIISIFQDPVLL
ncbi:MAG: hypothetical protein PWP08_734 [Methanofollis sp.]|nr:hypothetical protein [Methanofollis sp.]